VTAQGVRHAVERLLGEPEFAAAAGALQDQIAAMPDPDVVLAGLG
jgi:hypothetical protein